MNTRQTLLTAFGTLALLVLLSALTGLRTAASSQDAFERYNAGASHRMWLATHMLDAANARAVAARNMLLTDDAAMLAAEHDKAAKAHASVQDYLNQLRQSADASGLDKVQSLVAKIALVEARYAPVALDIVARAAQGDRQAATTKLNRECKPLLAELLDAGETYLAFSAERGRAEIAQGADSYASARLLLLALTVLAIAAAVALGWLIPRALMRSLGAEPATLGQLAQRIADGDLSPVPGGQNAPPRSVMAAMSSMQANLAEIVSRVRQGSNAVAAASSQITQGSQDLSDRTEMQAGALQQTAASMGALSGTVRQNADNAHQANELARGATDVARQGGAAVADVVRTMKDINDSSRRITDITTVIDGIAFQTNILALNAAVEAARAGEQGRGFAVVASEVRSLAQRSAAAAREIKSLIGESVTRVEQGSLQVDRAGSTMQDVVTAIQRVAGIVAEISAASVSQSQGVTQIGETVHQMDQSTQQNAGLVEQSAADAASLQQQAAELVNAVARFRLTAAA